MKTRAEYMKEAGSAYLLKQKVKRGELFKIEPGIYSEKEDVPELAVIAFKYPNAVITMRSALYLYKLIDEKPDLYELATSRDAAKISDKRVKQYFESIQILNEGIEMVDYEGYQISVYSKERLLVEVLRYKTKMPHREYKKIVSRYRRLMPYLDVGKVLKYVKEAPKRGKLLDMLDLEIL